MAATELDPRTALVLIDLQNGIVAAPTVQPAEQVVANAARLATAFRDAGLPVVLVRVTPSPDGQDALSTRVQHSLHSGGSVPADYAEYAAELGMTDTDILITKRQWGAFYGTELDLQLRRRGITGIVLGGIATSIGVESTARAAHEHGYNITFATDAMTDISTEAQDNSQQRIFPLIGELDTTDTILKLLPH
jgi:nicotinamidase-related amidase